MYFDESFYTESFEQSEKSDNSKTEHAYYLLKSGEWLCLSCTYKKVKKEYGDEWEKTDCESSVSQDKPGEPSKEDYLKRIIEVVKSSKEKKGSY